MNDYDFDFQQIVEAANDVVIATKAAPIEPPGPEMVYVNEAFTRLTEYTFEEAVGRSPRILQSSDTELATKRTIKQALQDQASVRVTIKNYSKSGRQYWLDLSILPLRDATGEVTHFVAIERDVTEQKLLEEKLEALSMTDSLTGLLNRRCFEQNLAREFSRCKRQGGGYALLMLDVDHFKSINDSFGHQVGDLTLKTLAKRCQQNLRAHDSMARLGGEEFCVLLPLADTQAAFRVAEKLRTSIANQAFSHDGLEVAVTISVGLSQWDAADGDALSALERADKALYEAKQTGRNRIYVRSAE